MASIVEWNISESFCLRYFYRCVFYSFLYFLKRNEFWFVVHLQSKIGLHKTPQAAQPLASDEDVKRILRGFLTFVKHSSRIPLRSTSAWEATQALVCKWFPQKKPAPKKNISFQEPIGSCSCGMYCWIKNVIPLYAREIYSISTGLGNKFLLRVNHPYFPSKDKCSTPND